MRLRRHDRERGQVMVLMAAGMLAMVAMSALAIDFGLQQWDQRRLAKAADEGALTGAYVVVRQNATAAMTAAEEYAWSSLSLAMPSGGACTTSGSTETCTASGYTIAVTTPYVAQDPIYLSIYTVSVDITHVNPVVGFARALGFSTFTNKAHSAATAHVQTKPFPFALAARFLDIQGSGTAAAYGAVLVDECDDSGKGDFTDHGVNGGIYFNGGTSLAIGGVTQSSGGSTNYVSGRSVLVADGRTGSCTPSSTTNTNPDSYGTNPWVTLGDKVQLSASAADANEWNDYYGFNSGPTGCAVSGSQSSCESSGVGDGTWEDSCWTSGGTLVPVQSEGAYYQIGTGFQGTSGTYNCGSDPSNNTFEGSFSDSQWPGLPGYVDPATSYGISVPTSAAQCTGGTLSAGNNTFDHCYTAISNSYNSPSFAPGYYIFYGASYTTSNGASWTCQSGTSGTDSGGKNYAIPGCLFIFANGGAFSMQGQTSYLNCSNQLAGDGNCAFEFTQTGTTASQFSLSGKMNVNLTPIQDPTSQTTYPVLYSLSATNCLNTPNPCAVFFGQPGAANVGGTFFVPYGVVNFNANASPLSGQIIADTIQMQGGASAVGAGVVFRSDLVAQVAGLAELIEG